MRRAARADLADVPANVLPELKALIAATFSPDAVTRGNAAKSLGETGAGTAPAVPFLIRLLTDDAHIDEADWLMTVSLNATWQLTKIGKPAVGPCIAALKNASTTNARSLSKSSAALVIQRPSMR